MDAEQLLVPGAGDGLPAIAYNLITGTADERDGAYRSIDALIRSGRPSPDPERAEAAVGCVTPLIALLCAPEAPPAVKQPQPRKKPSWAKGKKREHSFVLLVAANSELPIDEITELRVEAQTLSSLQTRVGGAARAVRAGASLSTRGASGGGGATTSTRGAGRAGRGVGVACAVLSGDQSTSTADAFAA
jgi:hypothetical protein